MSQTEQKNVDSVAQEDVAGLELHLVWKALNEVMDPEIPVLSLVDLGVIREVEIDGDRVRIAMTPTFSGCPALEVMRRELREKLLELGAQEVDVELVLSPPWSSDDISEAGREKLREFGLAPPTRHDGVVEVALEAPVACPRCGSLDTRRVSAFGTTLCREVFVCEGCGEGFEGVKGV